MYNMYVLIINICYKDLKIKISSSNEKYVFSVHLIQKSWPTLVYIITYKSLYFL